MKIFNFNFYWARERIFPLRWKLSLILIETFFQIASFFYWKRVLLIYCITKINSFWCVNFNDGLFKLSRQSSFMLRINSCSILNLFIIFIHLFNDNCEDDLEMISRDNPLLGPVCKSFRNACPIIGNDGTFSACSTESFQSPAPFFRNISSKKK